jgi:sugar phosphate isomerase/epimerase
MTRREILALAGAAPAWFRAASPLHGAQQQGKTRLGGAPAAFSLRARGGGGAKPFDIVEHCHQIGLGGVQTSLEAIDLDTARELRKRVEGYGMQLVLAVPQLPGEESQLYRFDNALKGCTAAGAYRLHAAMTSRRWEQFDSIEAFRRGFERSKSTFALAEPMLQKNKIKLAVETPGWRAAEVAEWLKDLDSEWVGVCFDFGNNLALCEDPMDTVRTLAPYTFMCHIKDVAVDTCEEGFLLSEVILGEGILNLKEMIRILREKDPNMPFYLDMTTGDPLKIPVFTDKYWATFDDSYSPLPGRDLSKILNMVRKNPPKKPLPRVTGLSPEAAVKFEDDNNLKCIEYARQLSI